MLQSVSSKESDATEQLNGTELLPPLTLSLSICSQGIDFSCSAWGPFIPYHYESLHREADIHVGKPVF